MDWAPACAGVTGFLEVLRRLNPNIDGHLQAKGFVNARPIMTMSSISSIRDGCLVTAHRVFAKCFDGTTEVACDRVEMSVSGVGKMSAGAIVAKSIAVRLSGTGDLFAGKLNAASLNVSVDGVTGSATPRCC